MFQACPDFKGIKTLTTGKGDFSFWFQACPDFKGIKTLLWGLMLRLRWFQACPDFKGIKTLYFVGNTTTAQVSSLP